MTEHKSAEEDGRYFGDRDWVLPYSICAAVIGLLVVALLTVGSKAMPLGTFFAFVAVIAWLVIGLCLVIIFPIAIGVSARRKRKFLPIVGCVLLGLAYFTVSGMLMANFSVPIS
jgi:uncharacterized membrane protein